MLKKFALILVILFLFPFTAYGAQNSAQSAIVIDADTNKILYEKNAYEERPMASTTKIMTALLAVESNRLDEDVIITAQMIDVIGSCLGLRAGDRLTFYDLVVGMMLTSGNDSANSVAYILSGSVEKFAQLMNKRAQQIGMKNTNFVTPSGLDEGDHHSTAYDMALLTSAAIKIDTFCEIVSKKSADIIINGKSMTVYNHNKLLSADESFFGVKTGFTEKAGRCLVSAKNYKNNRLICVTLSAPDDWNDHKSLYKECEEKYIKTNACADVDVPLVGGTKNSVKCSFNKEYYVLGDIRIEKFYHPFIYAPVKKGDVVGCACIYYNNRLLERLPITADEDVEYYVEQKRSAPSEVYG